MADTPGNEIERWADAAMYESQPMVREEGVRLRPRVFLLNATPDPLGTCAADMRMYRGDPVYSLAEITDEQRRWAWEELSKTALNTPLEGVNLKFMIEAVTRSFTHQMVRQRVGAYYVQESLRFAVKKGIARETALPPSIVFDPSRDPDLQPEGKEIWDTWWDCMKGIEEAYAKLIALGIPAEDARGLLPHAVTTRIIYHTNLRALFNEAGKRLCTQAQFEWRSVFLGMMEAIRGYKTRDWSRPEGATPAEVDRSFTLWQESSQEAWQWELISQPKPKTFTPVCYHTGTCQFMSMLDRGCSIRDRVLAFAEAGVPSDQWSEGATQHYFGEEVPDTGGMRVEGGRWLPPIDPMEWMADPTAGMTTETNRPT